MSNRPRFVARYGVKFMEAVRACRFMRIQCLNWKIIGQDLDIDRSAHSSLFRIIWFPLCQQLRLNIFSLTTKAGFPRADQKNQINGTKISFMHTANPFFITSFFIFDLLVLSSWHQTCCKVERLFVSRNKLIFLLQNYMNIAEFFNLPNVLAVHRKYIWWTKMKATTAERLLNIVVDPQLISIPKVGTRQHYCLSANIGNKYLFIITYSSKRVLYVVHLCVYVCAKQVNN